LTTEELTQLEVGTGDTGLTGATDAADAEVEEFFSSREQGKEGAPQSTESGSETDPGGKEPDASEEPDADLKAFEAAAVAAAEEKAVAAAERRLEEREAEREAEAARLQEAAKLRSEYNAKPLEIKQAVREALIAGEVDPEDIARIERLIDDRSNERHAIGQKIYAPDADLAVRRELSASFNEAAEAVLGAERAQEFFGSPEEPKSFGTWKEALTSLLAVGQTGYVTEAEALKREKSAVVAYKRAREREHPGEGQSSAAVVGRGGRGISYRTKAEAAALHVAGKLSNAEMRQVRGDPGIPEF